MLCYKCTKLFLLKNKHDTTPIAWESQIKKIVWYASKLSTKTKWWIPNNKRVCVCVWVFSFGVEQQKGKNISKICDMFLILSGKKCGQITFSACLFSCHFFQKQKSAVMVEIVLTINQYEMFILFFLKL